MTTSHVAKARGRRSNVDSSYAYRVFRVVALVTIVVLFLFPIVWMILASFKTNVDIYNPEKTFIFDPTITNYFTVFGEANFLPFFGNSLFVGAMAVGISLVLGLPAAYVMARFTMHRSSQAVLIARIIPGVSLIIPWYFIFANLGLTSGYTALILSHIFISLPLIVWVMMSFFQGLPVELEESGQVDGLSPIGAFLRISLPLALPGIATATILAFIFSWNNFLFALILSGSSTKTLPVAIMNFIGYANIDWGGLMAASAAITVPIMFIALFFQKYVVSGLTAGATKG